MLFIDNFVNGLLEVRILLDKVDVFIWFLYNLFDFLIYIIFFGCYDTSSVF